LRAAHKRFQTCQGHGVIDADLSRSRWGIAEKGHLRINTRLYFGCNDATVYFYLTAWIRSFIVALTEMLVSRP
jgi:hypothetical protein